MRPFLLIKIFQRLHFITPPAYNFKPCPIQQNLHFFSYLHITATPAFYFKTCIFFQNLHFFIDPAALW